MADQAEVEAIAARAPEAVVETNEEDGGGFVVEVRPATKKKRRAADES